MTRGRTLLSSADPGQEIPTGTSARLDRIQIALAALRDEERRLGRLGFEFPLARCREERRYWEFLSGMFAVASSADHSPDDGGDFARRVEPNR